MLNLVPNDYSFLYIILTVLSLSRKIMHSVVGYLQDIIYRIPTGK